MSTVPDQLASALTDRYRIERELGRGGMAVVYLAHDLKHDRRVALKVLNSELPQSWTLERFQREIRLAARLQHPHILSVFDSGDTGAGQFWFTMPYVDGESLRDRLRREGQLPLDDALRITKEAAQALQYAHEQGVIHRDIKPENLLLTRDGNTLVADFGVARAISADAALTRTGTVMGTPAYMSPEQAAGERTLDARTDVYSLGAVLYEMLAGEPPHTAATVQALIAKLMTERPTRLRTIRDALPEGIDAVVATALAKSPADRFPSADAFARALAQADRVAMPSRRMSGRGLLLAASAACLLILGGLFAARREHPAPKVGGPIRIAVLPFESVGDTSDATFADGMSEEITNRLARIPGLTLMGRSSVRRYRTSGQTGPEFGRALGVEYVLDGTVRGASAPNGQRQVRISPELIKVSDGTHLWGEPYEGVLADVFELQGNVAERVAVSLRGALGAGEQALVRAAPTENVEAYREYLLGREALGTKWWESGKAAKHFEAAIANDSNFARAYAGLAMAYSLAWDFGDRSRPRDSLYADARRAANRALALDSTLAEAHTALGWLHDVFDWDWRTADAEFQQALKLYPEDASARQWYAMHLLGLGRTADALSEARTAVRLDPLTPLTSNALGLAYWFSGRDSDAIRTFRGVLDWDSTGSIVPNLLGVYMTAGLPDEAAELARQWPDSNGYAEAVVAVARSRANPALRVEATRLLKRAVEGRTDAYAIFAGMYACIGERETALKLLEQSEAAHEERLMVTIKGWPALASLHDEPRYHAIIHRMGLPE
jgi:eukaryotic-like serine/threonine-protein kinase